MSSGFVGIAESRDFAARFVRCDRPRQMTPGLAERFRIECCVEIGAVVDR